MADKVLKEGGLTIREYAEREGISMRAAYQRVWDRRVPSERYRRRQLLGG
jgi:hypothetical protein